MSWQPVQPGLEHPGSRLEGRGKAGTWWLEMELFPEGGGKGETGKGQEWAWAKPHPLTIAGATSRCILWALVAHGAEKQVEPVGG